MIGESSARLGLPLLHAGQAGKELTHNEALQMLDLVVAGGAEALGVDAPPATPAVGQVWIVGPTPTGTWAGRAGRLAGWTAAGWRFVPPVEGLTVWIVAQKLHALFTGGAWVVGEARVAKLLVGGVPVIGARQPAITTPTGGATVDAEARTALADVLAALRAHGLISS